MICGCFVAALVWHECHTLLPLKVQNPPYRFPCSDGVAAYNAYESALRAEHGRAVASQHLRQIVLAALRYPCRKNVCRDRVALHAFYSYRREAHGARFADVRSVPRQQSERRYALRRLAVGGLQQRQSVGRAHEAQPGAPCIRVAS